MNTLQVFTVCLIFSIGVYADLPWSHQGIPDNNPAMQRDLNMNLQTNTLVQVQSTRKSNTSFEVFTFQVELGGLFKPTGPVKVALFYLAANHTNQLQITQDKFKVVFDSLSYTNATNTTFGQVNLANVQFQPLKVVQNGTNFDVTAVDVNGTFEVVVHIVNSVTLVNGTPLRPSSVKIDVNIQKQNPANLNLNTILYSTQQIATVTKNQSNEEQEGFVLNREKQISFGAAAVNNAFFSWVLSATLDGTTVPVLDTATPPQPTNGQEEGINGQKKGATFTFPTALTGLLKWDPKLAENTYTNDVAGISDTQATSPLGTTNSKTNSANLVVLSLAWVFALLLVSL